MKKILKEIIESDGDCPVTPLPGCDGCPLYNHKIYGYSRSKCMAFDEDEGFANSCERAKKIAEKMLANIMVEEILLA